MTIHDDLARATTAINEASSIALACHVMPDGDALGSTLAMLHVLRAEGRDVVASFPEPFTIAPHYRSMPGLDLLVPPAEFPEAPELMITFDCGSVGRLGNLGEAAKAADKLIVIDHHKSNDRYGTINVIDTEAASSGSVVRQLLASLGLPLNRDAAICLFYALVCDTARFQLSVTTPEVFGLAQELARFDVPITTTNRELFEEHRFAYLQMMAKVLQTATINADLGFVWAAIRAEDFAEFEITMEEAEGFIDILHRTQETDVTAVMKQEADGTLRCSLRSRGTIDASELAAALNGGGHFDRAGFTSTLPVEAVAARLTELVAQARA